MDQFLYKMKKSISVFWGIIFFIALMQSCGTKNENKMYLLEETTEFNQYIRQTDSIQYDPYKIALMYFKTKYPKPIQKNILTKMEWKEDWLHVDLVENNRQDSDKKAVKITLIFNRPMGVYQVHEIRHSWMCRNSVLFAAEDCK